MHCTHLPQTFSELQTVQAHVQTHVDAQQQQVICLKKYLVIASLLHFCVSRQLFVVRPVRIASECRFGVILSSSSTVWEPNTAALNDPV